MEQAVIILGHGSKAPQALATLEKLAGAVRENMPGLKVAVASLQFNRPDLADAVEELAGSGVKRIVVAPLFLFFGIHLQEDIPAILDELKKKYPGVEMVVAGNLGADNRIADIVVDRIKEVC